MGAAIGAIAWPLRRVRARLREIDYHSARRTRSIWTRLSDGWLLAALPVAVVVVCVGALVLRTEARQTLATGVIEQLQGGRVVAQMVRPGASVGGSGRFLGVAELKIVHRRAGWPVPIWVEISEPTLMIDTGLGPRTMPLGAPQAEAIAVRDALGVEAIDRRIEIPASGSGLRIGALIASIAVVWMALVPLGFAGIQGMRGLIALARRRRERRRRRLRAKGRCVECAYDLTGAEFSAACPECGARLD